MMAGKPIIMAIEAGNDLIKDADCGWRISPAPQNIATAIDEAFSTDHTRLQQLGQNGFNYVNQYHSYRKLATDFLNAIESHA